MPSSIPHPKEGEADDHWHPEQEPNPPASGQPHAESGLLLHTSTRWWQRGAGGGCSGLENRLCTKYRRALASCAFARRLAAVLALTSAEVLAHHGRLLGAPAAAAVRLAAVPAVGEHGAAVPVHALQDAVLAAVLKPWTSNRVPDVGQVHRPALPARGQLQGGAAARGPAPVQRVAEVAGAVGRDRGALDAQPAEEEILIGVVGALCRGHALDLRHGIAETIAEGMDVQSAAATAVVEWVPLNGLATWQDKGVGV
mmetsp:Transcript_124281/g.362867  ORF Transcript_124281/g.362867 Transcript_124281/m.362867 type:complete len:255 (+) Transcript_124281:321-1085(+)